MTSTLRGGTLIDGTGSDPRPADLAIDQGRIVPAAGGSDVIDVSGLTLVPGLIDAHAHLTLASPIDEILHRSRSPLERAADIFRVCGEALDEGFTTIRDVGGADGGLVAAVGSGRVRGPRLRVSGPIHCQTGGHGHYSAPWEPSERWPDIDAPGLCSLSLLSDGPDAMRANVREAFRRGAHFIKLCVTGGVISNHDALTDTQLTRDEIRAAVVEAEARGTYVTVHAHNAVGARNAIEAGVHGIEHGTFLDEETVALMAQRGVALVPTMTIVDVLERDPTALGLPEAIRERTAGVMEGMRHSIHMAREAGVAVGSGSDLAGPDQSGRGRELMLRAELEGPMAAIEAATRVNARIMGLGDDLGTLEPGRIADVVAFDGNPLEDPKLFASAAAVVLVLRDGEVVKDTRAS